MTAVLIGDVRPFAAVEPPWDIVYPGGHRDPEGFAFDAREFR